MRTSILLTLMALMVAPMWAQDSADEDTQPEETFLNISFIPSFGLKGFRSTNQINTISFNMLVGKSAGLRGVEFGGLVNGETGDVLGVQFSGISNIVGGDVAGIQFGGMTNHVGGTVTGIQNAGFVNQAGTVRGMQIGVVNLSDTLDGIALGIVNISKSGAVHPIL